MDRIMATTSPVFQAPQPLVIKSCTVALDKDEQSLTIPIGLQPRVAYAKYKWKLFLGAASPNSAYGTLGDVWVTTNAGYENVYIRGEHDEWNVWYKTIDYGQKRYYNDKNKFSHSYHPWLRDRLLQFNGVDLGWYPRRLYNSHRVSWNDKRSSGYPEYGSLDSVTVARYVKAVHLPRPALFGGVQPTASSSNASSSVPVYRPPPPAASTPAQPVRPLPPSYTTRSVSQHVASSSSTGQQRTAARPVPQIPMVQNRAIPRTTQPAAQTIVPPATATQPAPPRPVPVVNAQCAAPSSSASPPVALGQPRPHGLPFTGAAVQPTAPTSSSSVPTAVGPTPQVTSSATPKPAAPAAPKPAPPVIAQTTTPTPKPAPQSVTVPPAQPAPSVPADPPKYEDVVSESRVKRRRSSSVLSYASKERSPSPKRPNLGLKVSNLSDAIKDQPSNPSRSDTAPVATPATQVAPPATAAAASAPPAVATTSDQAPSTTSSASAVQPSPIPTTPTPIIADVQSRPTPAAGPLPPSSAPAVQPQADLPVSQPTSPASAQNPPSTVNASATVSSQSSDAQTGSMMSENASKTLPPPDPASINSFLDSLPLSLSHHTAVFTEVGVTNKDHLRLLTQLPKRDLDTFLTTLRGRGLSFMESLVLRSALNGLRQASEVVQVQGGPTSIEMWLEQMGPSMAHHAQVFRDLGIDFEHVPVLAQLDAETFQEFENALDTAGLTWIERFVITSKIRDSGRLDAK